MPANIRWVRIGLLEVHFDEVTAIAAYDGVVGPCLNMNSDAPVLVGERSVALLIPTMLRYDWHGHTGIQKFHVLCVAILGHKVHLEFASISKRLTGGSVVIASLCMLVKDGLWEMLCVAGGCDSGT